MSEFYSNQKGRKYFVVTDEHDNALGGCGFAEFGTADAQAQNEEKIAELQKLYIAREARKKGYAYRLIEMVEKQAKQAGYHKIYLETHHNLQVAMYVYQKLHYMLLAEPLAGSEHSAMDYFFIKDL